MTDENPSASGAPQVSSTPPRQMERELTLQLGDLMTAGIVLAWLALWAGSIAAGYIVGSRTGMRYEVWR